MSFPQFSAAFPPCPDRKGITMKAVFILLFLAPLITSGIKKNGPAAAGPRFYFRNILISLKCPLV